MSLGIGTILLCVAADECRAVATTCALGEGRSDDRGDRGESQENFHTNLFWRASSKSGRLRADYISVTAGLDAYRMETGKRAGEGGHAIRDLSLNWHQGMLLQHQGLPRSSKLKGIVRPVERGIEAMDRPMVIRTHEHEV